ncbi:MAG: hypothetical protein AAB456_04325 [Patescibacteria group bacterium]
MPNVTQPSIITDTAQISAGVIVDADVNASAAIAYSKLNLALGIVNADVSATAAIVDTKLATIATASKVSGAALTLLANIPAGAGVIPTANLPAGVAFANGNFTRAMNAAGGAQTIAHGLSGAPNFVRITATFSDGGAAGTSISNGIYNGTTVSCCWLQFQTLGQSGVSATNVCEMYGGTATNFQKATISVDATNITLTWTKGGDGGASAINIIWEAYK